jgi:Family of unknown function (DUF6444)
VERSEAEAIYDAGREVVVGVLLRMDEQIRRLEQRVARQDERIAQLERRLNRDSRNSSAPPSTDPPSRTPKRGKDPSGRRQGAQPGHEGHSRELLPLAAVDELIEHWSDRLALRTDADARRRLVLMVGGMGVRQRGRLRILRRVPHPRHARVGRRDDLVREATRTLAFGTLGEALRGGRPTFCVSAVGELYL